MASGAVGAPATVTRRGTAVANVNTGYVIIALCCEWLVQDACGGARFDSIEKRRVNSLIVSYCYILLQPDTHLSYCVIPSCPPALFGPGLAHMR